MILEYKKDLENGTITIDEAREILAHFFIKGCEWITGKPTNSGDAQHYQNIVLAGIDENSLLQAVDTAVEMNNNGDHGIPVPVYVEENVSTKVVKIIQSYTGVVNNMVWRK